MRIALYTLALDLMSGKESAILELATRSRHEWTVFTSHFDPSSTFSELSGLDVVDLQHDWYRRYVGDERGIVVGACANLPRVRLPLGGYDALYVVSAGLDHFVGWANRRVPLVSMCLTPLRLAYDPDMQAHYGDGHGLGVVKRAGAVGFRLADGVMWNRFAEILCISETVRRRLLQSGHVGTEKARVVYAGVDAEGVAPSWRDGEYFLVPGRLNWTKRIELAVEAYRRFLGLPGTPDDVRLVIAGSASPSDRPYVEKLTALIAEEPRISLVLSPSRSELGVLYDGCRAVLFTAINEDFGIVPLEAMAYGKPVICTGAGGPTETVIDGKTGLLCADADEFARALARITGDRGFAEAIGHAARTRALAFDWRHFVARTDERLERVVAGG